MNKYWVYVDSPVAPAPFVVYAEKYAKHYEADKDWVYAYVFYKATEPVAVFPDVLAIIREDAGVAE